MQVNPLQRRSPALDVLPEHLADNPRLSERDKIAEASRQFESVLLRQILESSTKTVIKSDLSDDSTAAGIYRDMVTNQLADCISKSGAFGLAQTFEQQLNRPSAKAISGKTSLTPPGARSASDVHLRPDFSAVKPLPLAALHE